MAAISIESARRVHLVDQQLNPEEVLDGVFEVSLDRLVAITSERVIIVSGGDSKGWALTGIPWRVITGVEFTPSEPGEANTLEVKYTARSGRTIRGEVATTEVSAEVCPLAEDDARSMLKLIEARLPGIVGKKPTTED
jgi:hypothetical protein